MAFFETKPTRRSGRSASSTTPYGVSRTRVRAWNARRATRAALSKTVRSRELDDIGLVRGDIDTL
jgi:uncharacterized protein YjiS (DUF1127 family)